MCNSSDLSCLIGDKVYGADRIVCPRHISVFPDGIESRGAVPVNIHALVVAPYGVGRSCKQVLTAGHVYNGHLWCYIYLLFHIIYLFVVINLEMDTLLLFIC